MRRKLGAYHVVHEDENHAHELDPVLDAGRKVQLLAPSPNDPCQPEYAQQLEQPESPEDLQLVIIARDQVSDVDVCHQIDQEPSA